MPPPCSADRRDHDRLHSRHRPGHDIVARHPGAEWLVLDASTINLVDLTGVDVVEELAAELAARGVRLGLANVHPDGRARLERAGALERIGVAAVFPTLNSATDAFLAGKRR